ncbi:hypothetical protein PGRAN_12654 [Listeria grandensis FSL F6-0971]|uniref:Uncharacterized protein n=1 Tax=Listeria grandensis FSL F6-0971 TaxID=1265819 RepID=W7BH97_9LIST|nr:hypothetical protein PGRAN_12654 [Listeria grandensis FSL F6-0971]
MIVLSRTKNGLLPESDYIQNHLKNVAQMPADVCKDTRIISAMFWKTILIYLRTTDLFLNGLVGKLT